MQVQATADQIKAIQTTFINKVYSWMTLALAITGFVALRTLQSYELMNLILSSGNGIMVLFLLELGLVFWMVSRIGSMSSNMAIGLFLLYSALNGLTLSIILFAYTGQSVAMVFFITAGTFASMSMYGYFTKKDLSGWGNFLYMALIGLIIASVVNLFMKSEAAYYLMSYIGVLIFVGLTAYDTQKIKQMSLTVDADSEEGRKGAILGALTLYLDFINMFIFLLRIFGNRR